MSPCKSEKYVDQNRGKYTARDEADDAENGVESHNNTDSDCGIENDEKYSYNKNSSPTPFWKLNVIDSVTDCS